MSSNATRPLGSSDSDLYQLCNEVNKVIKMTDFQNEEQLKNKQQILMDANQNMDTTEIPREIISGLNTGGSNLGSNIEESSVPISTADNGIDGQNPQVSSHFSQLDVKDKYRLHYASNFDIPPYYVDWSPRRRGGFRGRGSNVWLPRAFPRGRAFFSSRGNPRGRGQPRQQQDQPRQQQHQPRQQQHQVQTLVSGASQESLQPQAAVLSEQQSVPSSQIASVQQLKPQSSFQSQIASSSQGYSGGYMYPSVQNFQNYQSGYMGQAPHYYRGRYGSYRGRPRAKYMPLNLRRLAQFLKVIAEQ